MAIDIDAMVRGWDAEYESTLPGDAPPDKRRPFGRLLDSLIAISSLRFQPYRNDRITIFLEKLAIWLGQFPESDRKAAFLLANRILFVTERQFQSLQRRLFDRFIRRHPLEVAIARRGVAKYDFVTASNYLIEEMDKTIFVANSDSSNINSFVHENSEAFADRERRSLVGPELAFWTYAAHRAHDLSLPREVNAAAAEYEARVLRCLTADSEDFCVRL